MRAAMVRPSRPSDTSKHTPPEGFHPGQPLQLAIMVPDHTAGGESVSARLFYRHVNQAERWVSVEMKNQGSQYLAAIPADYTQSVYPLEYYFELTSGHDSAWLHPALNATLSNQPYYAISKRSA
jgi:hypothetical protein